MVPYLIINATSLFFHNRRFETPATKKNKEKQVKEWAQGLPQPPSKRQRTSVASTNRSAPSAKANPKLLKAFAPATTAITKSTSCATVVGSTTEVLTGRNKPALGTKRRAEELESSSDADDESTKSNPHYRGLGEDEDDTLERADAASSPVKASVAAQMSKVSRWQIFKFPIILLLMSISLLRRASIYVPGSQSLPKRRNPSSDKAIRNSLKAHLKMGGGRTHLSRHSFDMSAAQARTSGASNFRTPSQPYKQFGTRSTKEVPRMAGKK